MEGKLNEKLTPIAKEIFGEEVKVQSFFDNKYNEYNSLDMDVVDFMNRNERCSYVLGIFIDGGEIIDKTQEAEKINLVGEKLIENNILNENYVNIWYLREGEFSKVEEIHYDLKFRGQGVKYYLDENKIYNTASIEVKDKKLVKTIDDIISSFKY